MARPAGPAARFAALPGNLRGAAWMALGAFGFAAEALWVRWMTTRGVPVPVQVLARSVGQLGWVVPLLAASGLRVFHTRRAPLHLLRGLSSAVTWGLYFAAFGLLDLATATVLSFTNVMFTTLLARPVLGEQVGPARWAATLAGLLGVAVMLRPGAQVSLLGAAVALLGAVTWCGITLSSRALTRTEGTATIIAWVGLVTTVAALPFALAAWAPLGAVEWVLLAAFAAFTPAILYTLTEAFRAGEASAVAPFQYLRLVVIAGLGWALFGEVPDAGAWAGAALILAGAVVITLAEARRA